MVAAVVATPVITWWLIGDLSSAPDPRLEYTYIVRPPDPPHVLSVFIGALAVVALPVALGLLVAATVRGEMATRWWFPILVAMAAGAFLALCGRVVTAGSVDANIGGGMAVTGAVVIGGPMFIWSARLAWRASRSGAVPPLDGPIPESDDQPS